MECTITENYLQKRKESLQDLKENLTEELKRKTLVKNIYDLSILGGIETTLFLDDVNIENTDIHVKIKDVLLKQEHFYFI